MVKFWSGLCKKYYLVLQILCKKLHHGKPKPNMLSGNDLFYTNQTSINLEIQGLLSVSLSLEAGLCELHQRVSVKAWKWQWMSLFDSKWPRDLYKVYQTPTSQPPCPETSCSGSLSSSPFLYFFGLRAGDSPAVISPGAFFFFFFH